MPSCAASSGHDDIAANNTLLSYNIADATIQFISKGTITDNQTQGLVHPHLGQSQSVLRLSNIMRRTFDLLVLVLS